jgi:transposase
MISLSGDLLMMGDRTVMQEALFYSFSIEDHVPADHLLRSIDRFVDLGGLREHLRPYYSETGRPSIDPELMIRMLIIGYCMGIRSERRLCEEVHLNLAYRWFCRLGLEGGVPDHSTFSKNRHGRFRDSDLLRRLFEMTVERCMAEGLVGGEGFAVDASLIRADVHRQRSVPGEEGLPPQAVGRAVREYLDVLDDAAFGGATPVIPKRINLTDPASRWTAATREAAFYSYSTNYLIDLDHAVIVDVEATTSVRQAEVTAQRRMLERTQERFGMWPARLVADAAYGSAPNLAWLVEDRSIEPHIPVFDKSAPTSPMIMKTTATSAPLAAVCAGQIATLVRRALASIKTDRSAIARVSRTARAAPSGSAAPLRLLSNDAAHRRNLGRLRPTCPLARSPDRSTKARVTSRGISPRPTHISCHADSGRRSRCCSLISSAS